MDMSGSDPWRTFDEIREEWDLRFRAFFARLAEAEGEDEPIAFSPEVDLFETAQALMVKVALPGLIQDDIDIFIDGDRLTVRGERLPPSDAEPGAFVRQEWAYGRFERALSLPFAVNEDRIRASYSDGVLLIVLPRA